MSSSVEQPKRSLLQRILATPEDQPEFLPSPDSLRLVAQNLTDESLGEFWATISAATAGSIKTSNGMVLNPADIIKLDLSANYLTSISGKQLAEVFPNLRDLKGLNNPLVGEVDLRSLSRLKAVELGNVDDLVRVLLPKSVGWIDVPADGQKHYTLTDPQTIYPRTGLFPDTPPSPTGEIIDLRDEVAPQAEPEQPLTCLGL